MIEELDAILSALEVGGEGIPDQFGSGQVEFFDRNLQPESGTIMVRVNDRRYRVSVVPA